jgi:hypothetical protein
MGGEGSMTMSCTASAYPKLEAIRMRGVAMVMRSFLVGYGVSCSPNWGLKTPRSRQTQLSCLTVFTSVLMFATTPHAFLPPPLVLLALPP